MKATESERRIIEILVKRFKDYNFLLGIIAELDTEEERKKLINWLENTPEYSKSEVHKAIIDIKY